MVVVDGASCALALAFLLGCFIFARIKNIKGEKINNADEPLFDEKNTLIN